MVCGMASTKNILLATEPARDGVDTRKKDNCGMAAAVKQETTRLGAGDQIRDEQIAATMYLVPDGAEVEGSLMNAYWKNYLNLAKWYVEGKDEMFMFVSFDKQQSYNEADIARECNKLGPNTEGIINLYREFSNQAITKYRKTGDKSYLATAKEHIAEFMRERREQENAAYKILYWFRAKRISDTGTLIAEEEEHTKCDNCDEPSMYPGGGLCADCHWTEDARIKSNRRGRAIGKGQCEISNIGKCWYCGDVDQILHQNGMCGWCASK